MEGIEQVTGSKENSYTLMLKFVARICDELAEDGYSVLILGFSGVGKTLALGLVDEKFRDERVTAWNGPRAHYPTETGKAKGVYYVLMGQPLHVSLHRDIPADWKAIVIRDGVHRDWLSGVKTVEGDTKGRKPGIRLGELAIVCDECTGLIRGDEGFLTVVPGHDGKRRWRAYHGDCESLANVIAREPKSIVVRTGRVATYTELLATLAELAQCPQMDFAGTAWPGLLQRLAFDTDWQLTDGRSAAELGRENARFMASAGFSPKVSRLMTPAENERESTQRELRRDEDRRARARELARDVTAETDTKQESIA